MAAAKTETITVRIDPAVKAGLKAAAEQQHRSIANMVEVLIRDHCGRTGIPITEPDAVPESTAKASPRTKKSARSGSRNRHA
jgi:hypothetical protein